MAFPCFSARARRPRPLIAAVLVAAACTGDSPTAGPEPVARVDVTSPAPSVAQGDTLVLSAVPRDGKGNPLTGRTVEWSSGNPAVLKVDGSGRASGEGVGTATVTARSEGQSGEVTVTVTPPALASLALSRDTATLHAGATLQLSATPRDRFGGTLSGRAVSWTSSAEAVARVDGQGLVTATGVGTATVTASSEGRTAQATITVVPVPIASLALAPDTATLIVGSTLTLRVTARDAAGNELGGRQVMLVSSNGAVATLDGLTVRATGPGTSTITASAEGRTAQATITVRPVPVATVEVSPATATVEVGRTVDLGAIARDAQGNALTGRAVAWSSSNTGLATVSATGVVTGVAPGGPVTITATVEGRTGTAAVTVAPRAIGSVEVAPAPATVEAGRTVQLSAQARDADGHIVTGRTVTWTSSNSAVAAVSATGLVTGVAPGGPVTITAAVGGKAGTSAVTVVPRPVANVEVTPMFASIEVGTQVDLAAIARDADGNVLTGRAVTWSSANPAIAAVSATGVVTGVAAGGPINVSATVEGKAALASITVTPVPVATVEVSPASASIAVGGSVDLAAIARDARGNVLTGRAVTWSHTDPNVASVNATGVVTGVSAGGPTTIAATVDGKSGRASITVVAAYSQVTAGFDHTCGLDTGGTAFCWGDNEHGQLGNGMNSRLASRTTPARVLGGLVFARLAAGGRHTCGITTSGRTYCWGWGGGGQLGNGAKADASSPVEVESPPAFVEVTAGFAHTCGRTAQGAAYCWGSNYRGQLGTGGGGGAVATPQAVSGGHSFTRLDAGNDWTCGIASDGRAYCWGNHYEGQLGIGDASETCDNLPCARTPAAVAGGVVFREVSAGYNHTCAIASGGAAYCWGISGAGALGNGTSGPGAGSSTPVPVSGGLSFQRISVENQTSCGITTSGDTYCWGNNGYKHGNGTGPNTSTPVRAATGLDLASVTVGGSHTCGVTVQKRAYCWGSNYSGQLGDGTGDSRALPVPVRNPAS